MEEQKAAKNALRLFGERGNHAPIFLLLAEESEAEAVFRAAAARTGAPFRLASLPVENWNDELSPWPSPPVFRGGDAFGGLGDETVQRLETEVLPAARRALEAPTAPCFLLGYSLAGLLAVYALYRTESFAGAVSASGSLWYPGFRDYALSRSPAGKPEKVCFSLGEREKKTKNPRMREVQADTEAVFGHFRSLGIPCSFRLDPGGHFQDAELRLALGIVWVLEGEAPGA